MSRKTDEEILNEMKAKRKREIEEDEADDEEYQSPKARAERELARNENDEADDPKKVPTQIIEREINLSLINDKANFVIEQLLEIKRLLEK